MTFRQTAVAKLKYSHDLNSKHVHNLKCRSRNLLGGGGGHKHFSPSAHVARLTAGASSSSPELCGRIAGGVGLHSLHEKTD